MRPATIPIVLFALLLSAFVLSSALFTNCGHGLAGCKDIQGDSIKRLVELDTTNVLRGLYGKPDTIKDTTKLRLAPTQPTRNFTATTARIERRFVWAFFAGLSGILSIINLIVAIVIARDLSPAGKRKRTTVVVAAATLLITLVLWLEPMLHMGVMYPLLVATVASPGALLGMPALPGVMSLLNALSTAVAIAMAIAIWYLLQLPGDATTSRQQLSDLKRRGLYLRIALYAGTAGLITGVLRMNATLYWMQSFQPLAHQAALDGLRTTLVSVVGGFYSLLLASLYVPAALVLQQRARPAIANAAADARLEADDADKEFTFEWSKILTRALAILGPLLAGPIGEFLKHLAG